MTKKTHLPADSKTYAELAFREKEKWHRRRERMSLARKLEVLDRLRERGRLPQINGNQAPTD
jgi:hypothetical protein